MHRSDQERLEVRQRRRRAFSKAWLIIAAIFAASLAFVLWRSPARAEDLPARQVWVIDGDTVDLQAPAKERVRLLAIDAPEIGGAHCEAERRAGDEAKRAAIAIVRAGTTVAVTRSGRTDPYGRTLADITIDGRDLGRTLLDRGLALPYRPGPDAKAARIAHWCRDGGVR